MAVTFKSAGTGAEAGASVDDIDPTYPATVDANDIAIAHLYARGTGTPSTPSWVPDDQGVWELLDGPRALTLVSNQAYAWTYGRILTGSEDGATANFGNTSAGTDVRGGRVYTFSGWESGAITDLVPAASFSFTQHATDPQMPTVTTTIAGSRPVALVGQTDDNAQASATGESGGNWTEAVGEFLSNAFVSDFVLGIQTATLTSDPGTISGGSIATADDAVGVVGFEIRPSAPAVPSPFDAVLYQPVLRGPF